MNKTNVHKHCGASVVTMLLLFFACPIFAQIDLTITTPSEINRCSGSEVVTISIENNTGEAVSNVTGMLNAPTGIAQTISSGSVSYSTGTTIAIPDLMDGEQLSFMLELSANCDLVGTSIDYTFEVNHDPITGGISSASATSGTFPVRSGDPAITTSMPNTFDGYLGFMETVNSTVVNSGDGPIELLYYCVEDNANAQLNGISVSGITLNAAVGISSGFDCFEIGPMEFIVLFGVPFMPAGESLVVEEAWEITTCATPADNINRRAQFGCSGSTDCLMEPTSSFPETVIEFNIPDPILDVQIEAPAEFSQCGPIETICVTVTYSGPAPMLTNLSGTLDLPTGMVISNLQPKTGGPVTQGATATNFNLPDLAMAAPGNVVAFNLDIQATCDFIGQDGTYEFTVTHDPLCETSETQESQESTTFFVQEADLSIPTSTPTVIDAFFGLVETISTTVANGGNGSLDNIFYCVSPNPNLTLVDLQVGGVSLLPAATSTPGFDCYIIGPDALMAVFGTPFMPNNSNLIVEESWEVTDCTIPTQDILRRVQYGCQGTIDCQAKPQSSFPNTGINFGVAIPDLDVSLTSISRPACFVDNLTPVDITITNNGTAPAKDIVISISAGGGAIDLTNYAITPSGTGMPETMIDLVNTDPLDCTMGVKSIRDTIRAFNLEVGESLLIHYDLLHVCGCNNCSLDGIYESTFRVNNYDDLCDRAINESPSVGLDEFDAFITGFVEGPLDMVNGQKSTIEYTITGMQLDWFINDYPDAYLETFFEIPCGLDYDPTSVVFMDRNGTVWPSCEEDAPDSGGDDVIRVRWCQADRPNNFIRGSGASMAICVIADCAEKPAATACANPVFDLQIAQTTFITIDESCTNCPTEKIWQPENLETRVFCPNVGGCPPCEGLVFDDLSILRANYGMGDANNDQVPDGPVDLNLVQRDRFLQGDTLRAIFNGTVSDPNDTDWTFGFATIQFPNANFSLINSEVEIVDADGLTYTCSAVLTTSDMTANQLVVDFSVDVLNALGCGLPTNFQFDQGDQVNVLVNYLIKDPFDGLEQQIIYDTEFYLSEMAFGLGAVASCNDRRARLTQVGLRLDENCRIRDFGACTVSNWNITYERHFGTEFFDEFPYEIRPVGLPQTITIVKPSEFKYRKDEFGVRLRQQIPGANNIVNIPNGTIPPEFLLQNGDTITFLAETYFNSLGDSEIPPDEGYQFVFFPAIQGSCQSIAGNYDMSYFASESVDENVYCTPTLTRDTVTKTFEYRGGASLEVIPDLSNIRLCSASDTVFLTVNNPTANDAFNAFLYVESPTGGVIPLEVFDVTTDTPIMGNDFGIYPLGDLRGATSTRIKVVILANNCAPESLDFVAGWDCESLPTTVDEALCADPSVVNFTSADAGLNLDIIDPVMNQFIPLCEEVPYEVEIRSTDLGYLRDIELLFDLPPGQDLISGSLEIAVPAASQGGTYVNAGIDPTLTSAGYFVDVSSLDTELTETGLIGSKDLTQNKVSIRFRTETTCDYLSGSRARFRVRGNSNCGNAIRPVRKPAGRIRITTQPPSFNASVTLGNLVINPCQANQTTSIVNVSIDNGIPSVLDSVRYLLPEGITYVNNSYQPLLNASPDPPQVRTEGGKQILVWPIDQVVSPGQNISFSVAISAMDIGQFCGEYDLEVEAFSRVNELCDMMTCSVAILAGSGTGTITLAKPELTIDQLDADLSITSSTNEGLSVFNAEVCNNGATLQAGQEINLDIYEDVDRNGFRSAPDILLFTINQVLTQSLENGECALLSGSETFTAGTVCTIIGVVDPNNTCACSEVPSFQVRPEVEIIFDQDAQVCSREPINIGPNLINGYDFEWLSINGSDLGALSATNTTPVTFVLPNTTGAPITYEYALRSSTSNCFVFDTVSILVAPEQVDSVDVLACMGESFDLPSQNLSGSNFIWTPDTDLSFPFPDSSFAMVDLVTVDAVYVLDYIDNEGCPASFKVNLTAVDCGSANTALGDTVWFDFNLDGLQSPMEPGIEGVVVNLYDALTGSIISSTITNADGFYIFDNLVQGTYFVEFLPLPGFVGTLANQGSDVDDSDANPITGITGNYFLPWDTFNPTVDAGFIPDCTLDLQVSLSDCIPSADTVAREVRMTVTWSGNPYTYDQFFEADTIVLSALGETFKVAADTLFGTATVSFITNADIPTGTMIT
ncbi:MAG: SdrD B-like domain-containing protein, partial [Bacteroidota bacterium]